MGRGIGPNRSANVAQKAVRMSGIDVDFVGRTMGVLLMRAGRPVVYDDPANGQRLSIGAREASAADGFLPAFLVAGEAIWREATGKGFALDIVHDDDALLGYRVRSIGGGTFASVMLASMEAIHQVAGPNAIMVSDFNAVWRAAVERLDLSTSAGSRTQVGLTP